MVNNELNQKSNTSVKNNDISNKKETYMMEHGMKVNSKMEYVMDKLHSAGQTD